MNQYNNNTGKDILHKRVNFNISKDCNFDSKLCAID